MADPTIEEDMALVKRYALAGYGENVSCRLGGALQRIATALKDQSQNPWGDDGHHVYEVIRQRYRGGETAHELAVDYAVTTDDIARALVEPHSQCGHSAICARNAGHGGICWPKQQGERARKQGSGR